MRIEILDDIDSRAAIPVFPPSEDYVDLRENPRAVEQIALVREYLPLRNFLTALNSAGSVFASASAATESNSASDRSSGEAL